MKTLTKSIKTQYKNCIILIITGTHTFDLTLIQQYYNLFNCGCIVIYNNINIQKVKYNLR